MCKGKYKGFDQLPNLVHDGIFGSMTSPRDVANLIRASPGALGAFTGRREVVLLAVMQSSLSLENQHLMNLLMAAPHYYKRGQVPQHCHQNSHIKPWTSRTMENTVIMSTSVEFDGVSKNDFKRTAEDFLTRDNDRDQNMRQLTRRTFECAIRLYDTMDREIRYYTAFTLARAKGQINDLSDPTRFRSTYQSRNPPPPNHKEMTRLWRGFLVYELLCVIHGIPWATDTNFWSRAGRDSTRLTRWFRRIALHVREEIVCVQKYVLEQYQLALNMVLEDFRLAVNEMGRRQPLGRSRRPRGSTAAPKLLHRDFPESVEYLHDACDDHAPSDWATHFAMLGVSFMQEFLCWDYDTRLDLIRTTPDLTNTPEGAFHYVFRPDLQMLTPLQARFGRPKSQFAHLRFRAVGWVF